MARLSELRKQAKEMGISPAVLRRATTAAELERAISDEKAHSRPRKKSGGRPVKKSSRTTTARKKSTTRTSTTRKASGRKASTPAKSNRATKAKRSSNSNGDAGRFTLERVNFKKKDGWNPREGSPPDLIIKSLAKHKGDRTAVFNELKKKVWTFVDIRTRNKRDRKSLEDAYAMLRYRISRTAWDFAMRTGQHEPSSNRVRYGDGDTGTGVFKRAGSRKASKPAAKKTTRKPARKPASRQRPAQRRTGVKVVATRKRGRGRPKAGSRR